MFSLLSFVFAPPRLLYKSHQRLPDLELCRKVGRALDDHTRGSVEHIQSGALLLGPDLAKFGLKADARCPICGSVDDSLVHRLYQCEGLRQIREDWRSDFPGLAWVPDRWDEFPIVLSTLGLVPEGPLYGVWRRRVHATPAMIDRNLPEGITVAWTDGSAKPRDDPIARVTSYAMVVG